MHNANQPLFYINKLYPWPSINGKSAEFGRGILNDQMNLNQLQQKIDKFLPKMGKTW